MTSDYSVYQASDYERIAAQQLDHALHAYIAGGAGKEQSLQANLSAFDRIQLKQRAFADYTHASTRFKLFNKDFRHPILLAPVAAQSLVHPDGEIATAQAADALEAGMIVSTRTSKPLHEVAGMMRSNKWFQLYFQADQQANQWLLDAAHAAHIEAIVVTLDSPVQSLSIRAQAAGFRLPAHAQPIMLANINTPQPPTLTKDQSMIFHGIMPQAPTLADLEWLIANTTLPVLIKGVMCEQEIKQLLAIGVSGFIISNHGGRALDGVPDSLTLLKNIRQQIEPNVPLLLDSGVRSGADVFKAIALGASAVCIGRLQMYALAINGAHGVAHLLKLLRDELELCMALTGCPTLADINPHCLYQDSHD